MEVDSWFASEPNQPTDLIESENQETPTILSGLPSSSYSPGLFNKPISNIDKPSVETLTRQSKTRFNKN